MYLLEIAVFNIESALAAAAAGADRLELCENASEGGTTPSYGTLQYCKQNLRIPVFPIIRPRGGDFLYTDAEFDVMKADVQLCRQLGFEGVVLGLLHADGTVDVKRTRQLVELAYPMEVTFHRAFDRAADPFRALEAVMEAGCQRILTSGQVPNAHFGIQLISQLIEQAAGNIVIMPGSGVRSDNIRPLAEQTGAVELHSSARKALPSGMQFRQLSMNEELKSIGVDTEEIRRMRQVLDQLASQP